MILLSKELNIQLMASDINLSDNSDFMIDSLSKFVGQYNIFFEDCSLAEFHYFLYLLWEKFRNKSYVIIALLVKVLDLEYPNLYNKYNMLYFINTFDNPDRSYSSIFFLNLTKFDEFITLYTYNKKIIEYSLEEKDHNDQFLLELYKKYEE